MNQNQFLSRRFSAAAFLAILIAASGLFPGGAQASPADEISRAVVAAGAASVKQADATTFTKAFSSVVIRAKHKDVASYVTAAVQLRPDLAPQITVAALKAHRPDTRMYDSKDAVDSKDLSSCGWVDPIIRAAIAAAPDAADAIVREALLADPSARACILAAAGRSSETQTAFFRPPGVDAGNVNGAAIGTINPANIGSNGQGNVNTPENDQVTICHNGQTIVVSRQGAEFHIRNHPTDHLGPCGP